MPFIQITILEGRSPRKKERLIHEVSDLTAEILESPIENVRVHIQETSAEHWGIAGNRLKKEEMRNQNERRTNKSQRSSLFIDGNM